MTPKRFHPTMIPAAARGGLLWVTACFLFVIGSAMFAAGQQTQTPVLSPTENEQIAALNTAATRAFSQPTTAPTPQDIFALSRLLSTSQAQEQWINSKYDALEAKQKRDKKLLEAWRTAAEAREAQNPSLTRGWIGEFLHRVKVAMDFSAPPEMPKDWQPALTALDSLAGRQIEATSVISAIKKLKDSDVPPESVPLARDAYRIAAALLGRAMGVDERYQLPAMGLDDWKAFTPEQVPGKWSTVAQDFEKEAAAPSGRDQKPNPYCRPMAALAYILAASSDTNPGGVFKEASEETRKWFEGKTSPDYSLISKDTAVQNQCKMLRDNVVSWKSAIGKPPNKPGLLLPFGNSSNRDAASLRKSVDKTIKADIDKGDLGTAFLEIQKAKAAEIGSPTGLRTRAIAELPKPGGLFLFPIYVEMFYNHSDTENKPYSAIVYVREAKQSGWEQPRSIGPVADPKAVIDAIFDENKLNFGKGGLKYDLMVISPDGPARLLNWLEEVMPAGSKAGKWLDPDRQFILVPSASKGWTMEMTWRLWYATAVTSPSRTLDLLELPRIRLTANSKAPTSDYANMFQPYAVGPKPDQGDRQKKPKAGDLSTFDAIHTWQSKPWFVLGIAK